MQLQRMLLPIPRADPRPWPGAGCCGGTREHRAVIFGYIIDPRAGHLPRCPGEASGE